MQDGPVQSTQPPTIGRIVHYVSYGTPNGEFGKECRAAVVTAVDDIDGTISVCVFNPTGQFFNSGLLQDLSHAGGTWHWPERDV